MSTGDQIKVGVCGACGGEVTVPRVWHSVVPPRPQCSRCHRYAKPQGPMIEMENKPRRVVPSAGVNGEGFEI